jgi:hypothetical protein
MFGYVKEKKWTMWLTFSTCSTSGSPCFGESGDISMFCAISIVMEQQLDGF